MFYNTENAYQINKVGFWGCILSSQCRMQIVDIANHLTLHLRHVTLPMLADSPISEWLPISIWIVSMRDNKEIINCVTKVSKRFPNSKIRLNLRKKMKIFIDGTQDVHISGYVTFRKKKEFIIDGNGITLENPRALTLTRKPLTGLARLYQLTKELNRNGY